MGDTGTGSGALLVKGAPGANKTKTEGVISLKTKTRKKFLKLVARVRWRKTWSWIYRNSAHEYLVSRVQPVEFAALAKMVRKHGRRRPWRSQSYRFLEIGRFVYWLSAADTVNRTYRGALSHGGYPSEKVQQRIRKRFWVGRSR
jgi:hypothetical protein